MSGNFGAGKAALCKGLARSLPTCKYMKDLFCMVSSLPDYNRAITENKKTGQRYNKHALPVYMEFLELIHRNEMEADRMSHGYVVMNRCIHEQFEVFVKNGLELGKLTRPHNSRGVQAIRERLPSATAECRRARCCHLSKSVSRNPPK